MYNNIKKLKKETIDRALEGCDLQIENAQKHIEMYSKQIEIYNSIVKTWLCYKHEYQRQLDNLKL